MIHENIVTKGKTTHPEKFLLLSQYFLKLRSVQNTKLSVGDIESTFVTLSAGGIFQW